MINFIIYYFFISIFANHSMIISQVVKYWKQNKVCDNINCQKRENVLYLWFEAIFIKVWYKGLLFQHYKHLMNHYD
jgi:hypothetical protein